MQSKQESSELQLLHCPSTNGLEVNDCELYRTVSRLLIFLVLFYLSVMKVQFCTRVWMRMMQSESQNPATILQVTMYCVSISPTIVHWKCM